MGPLGAVLGGASLLSGFLGYDAADKAADAQLAGVNAGIGEQRRQFDLMRSDQAPYRDAGYAALGRLSDLINAYRPFDGTELASDPGYQFGMREGRNALEQSAAARGGLFSGKTMRDLLQFGQDYGSTMFDRRMNMRLNEQNQRYNQLAGVAGTGQNAVNASGAFGAQSAGTIADLFTQGGNARASGIVGGTNAITGTMGNLTDLYLKRSLLDGGGFGGGGTSMRSLDPAPFSGPFSASGR